MVNQLHWQKQVYLKLNLKKDRLYIYLQSYLIIQYDNKLNLHLDRLMCLLKNKELNVSKVKWIAWNV